MRNEGGLLCERKGRILLLTMNNPEARNALGPAIWVPLIDELVRTASDPSIGVAVLTGAGGVFSSGGDLNRMQENRKKGPSFADARLLMMNDLVQHLRSYPKPVIAAVEGAAAGAGFSLALACDFIVAADDVKFFVAQVKVGITPDGGISAALARTLPPQMLSELFLGGGIIQPEALRSFGLVNRTCPKGEALQTALDFAEKLAKGPARAMARIKYLIEEAYKNELSAQLDLERQLVVESIYDDECGEGIEAFFSKRPAVFNRV